MQPLVTRVESVTLYHAGATVLRAGALALQPAPTSVLVAGLPLSLLDSTVRARVETEGGDALIVTNVRVGLWAPPRGTPAAAPQAQALRAVEQQLERAQDALRQLADEVARLSSFPVLPRPPPAEGKAPSASPMPARFALEQLAQDALASRLSEQRAARAQVKALEEQAAALHRALQLASTAQQVRPDELTKSVHLTLLQRGAAPTRARLVLEYFVTGARWAPVYQCRMSRDCQSADLQLRASVCQRTGEDWAGVTLQLSTASPMSWTALPELSAVRIGALQPLPAAPRGFRPPPAGSESLFLDYDRGLRRARAALPVIPTWAPPAVPQAALASFGASADELSRADEDDGEAEPMAYEEAKVAKDASPRRAMAAPAPMAAAPSLMRPERAPMASKKLASRAGAGAGRMRESADGFADLAESEPSVRAEVLLYASLRLVGPEDGLRGKLRPVELRQAYLESLAALGLHAAFDVLGLVSGAQALGQGVVSSGFPAGQADVRAAAGFFDYVYRTDAAVDVPSDGTFHSVPVSTRAAKSEVLYVTVPREDALVYRQALVKNPLEAPLLPGPVEVYVAGEYVLTTQLPTVAPGGDFKLALGVEQGIKVARNTVFSERRSGDKVVATNELLHALTIELVNNLERPVQCEVRERIPQPAADAEVVVEEAEVTPPWEPYTQEERSAVLEGGRRWRLTVKANSAQTLQAQYRVKLYANNELVGGNRREA